MEDGEPQVEGWVEAVVEAEVAVAQADEGGAEGAGGATQQDTDRQNIADSSLNSVSAASARVSGSAAPS